MRLITNKPDPSGFSGRVKFGTAYTSEGEPSNNIEAVINAPLNNTLTLRGVVYVDNQGGYIDNVSGSVIAADAEVKSIEGDFIWVPAALEGLTLSGGFSLLDNEITDSFVTTFIQEGDELAFASEFQANLQARYE